MLPLVLLSAPATAWFVAGVAAPNVVEVSKDGLLYEGERFSSLSEIAGKITGTGWAGPRFFGLVA